MHDPNKKTETTELDIEKKKKLSDEELQLLDEGELVDVQGQGPIGFPPTSAA